MTDPVHYWLQKVAGYKRTDIKWGWVRMPKGGRTRRKRVALLRTPSGTVLKVSRFGSPTRSAHYELNAKTAGLVCRPPAARGRGGTYALNGHRDKYGKCLSMMERVMTCGGSRCKRLRYYLRGLRSVVGRTRNAKATCPPSLAREATVPLKTLKIPQGRAKTMVSVDAQFSFNIRGNRRNERNLNRCPIRGVACYSRGPFYDRYRGRNCVHLRAAKTQSSPPVVSGVAYAYIGIYKKLIDATHVVLSVVPRSKGFVILEIYEADELGVYVAVSKDPKNKWLPRKDVDLFKVRIPVVPSKKWQQLVVPLSLFVDWNRKRKGCAKSIKGVNEDIGDGVLNPLRGESFQFQVVLEAEKPGMHASAYIGRQVRFVKYLKARTK